MNVRLALMQTCVILKLMFANTGDLSEPGRPQAVHSSYLHPESRQSPYAGFTQARVILHTNHACLVCTETYIKRSHTIVITVGLQTAIRMDC